MRRLLPLALTIGLSAAAFAQDSNTCMCTNNGDVHTRVINGKVVQEDKHTINVITPAPGQSSTTYVASYNSDMPDRDVRVHVRPNGTVVQTDKTTINRVTPAPSDVAMISNGYVMTPGDNSDVRVTVEKNGTVVQTDKTTINKITPMPGNQVTTVTNTTTTTTTTNSDYQD